MFFHAREGESMKRTTLRKTGLLFMLLSLLGLSGCGGGVGSPNNTQTPFFALFDPANSVIPFPNNVLFSGSTDGTLNIPLNPATFDPADPYADPTAAMNTLDGFSTSAPISTGFNAAIAPASIDPYSVRLFEVTADPYTTAVTGIVGELVQGRDYMALPSPADPTKLVLKPLLPLKPATHYLAVLTSGLTDNAGNRALPSFVFGFLKQTTPLVDANGHSLIPADDASAQQLEPLRQLTQAMLGFAATQGVNPADVAICWTFKTQTLNQVLPAIEAESFNNPYTAAVNFITNAAPPSPQTNYRGVLDIYTFIQVNDPYGTKGLVDLYASGTGPLANVASVVIGEVDLSYYLDVPANANDPTPLASTFSFNPGSSLPVTKSVQTVPFLLTVPNSAGPWPVVIFQHGFTVDKSVVMGIAGSLAQAGFATIAIDAVLHGDRTFALDFVTPVYDPVKDRYSNIWVPDGNPDPSGTHYLNLGHLLTARDNVRQSVADLIHLTRLIENQTMDVVNNADGSPAYQGGDGVADLYSGLGSVAGFVGHSNGGILGTMLAATDPYVQTFVLANPGGVYSDIFQNSVEISPLVNAGLAAKGVTIGSPDYFAFLAAAQTVADDADPFNYAPLAAAAGKNILLFKQLNDQVVPNASTDLLSGALSLVQVAANRAAGTWPVVVPSPYVGSGFVKFLRGTHSSFLKPDDPIDPLLVGLDVITEMQTETATFLGSALLGGATIQIGNATGPNSGQLIVE